MHNINSNPLNITSTRNKQTGHVFSRLAQLPFIVALLYCALAATIFYFILRLNIPTDIQLHSDILKQYLALGAFPNPPLYYLSIYLLNLFFADNFFFAAVLVLSGACFFKYLSVHLYLSRDNAWFNTLTGTLVSVTLMFVGAVYLYPLDGPNLYLGKFTSSIWHNSTTIFVFPFCIWLFLESLNYLQRPVRLSLLKMLGIGLLILLSKPSFLFSFVVVFPIVSLYQIKKINQWVLYAATLCVFLVLLLFIQKTLIYQYNPLDKLVYNGEASRVVIAPFEVWLAWTRDPLMSLFTSFLFITAFFVVKLKSVIKDVEVVYAFLLLVVSLFLFFTLAESGPRLRHGNFYWQVPIAMLLANMVFLKKLIIPLLAENNQQQVTNSSTNGNRILLFLYALHVISGLYYVVKIFSSNSFY